MEKKKPKRTSSGTLLEDDSSNQYMLAIQKIIQEEE